MSTSVRPNLFHENMVLFQKTCKLPLTSKESQSTLEVKNSKSQIKKKKFWLVVSQTKLDIEVFCTLTPISNPEFPIIWEMVII